MVESNNAGSLGTHLMRDVVRRETGIQQRPATLLQPASAHAAGSVLVSVDEPYRAPPRPSASAERHHV